MGEPIQVLLVDDEPSVATLAAEFLEESAAQLTVTTATSAEVGREVIEADGVDCVVSDYDMPGETGIEFLEGVRAEHGDLPFVLFTAKGSEEVASDAISAGASDYVQKGTGVDQYEILANRVRNAVEQRRAESKAQETQRQLQSLAENTNDVLWMFSADWSELRFINEAYEAIWGRSTAELRERPRSFLEGVHPDDRASVREAMETLSGGEPVDLEYRVNAAEDFGRWVWVQGVPVTDGEGTVEGVAGFARDVTGRKAAEMELRSERDRFERLVSAVEEYAIFRLDTDGRVTTWNAGAERIKGYTEGEILGEHFSVFYPEAAVAAGEPARLLAQATDDGSVQTEGWRVRQDGSQFWANVTITALFDDAGELRGFSKVTRDLTERRDRETELQAANEELRELQRQFELTLAATDTYAWRWDLDADTVTRTPELTGVLDVDDAPTTVFDGYLERVHPDQREPVEDAFRSLQEAREPYRLRYQLETDDGWVWVEDRGDRLAPGTDASAVAIGLVTDISDRREQERALEHERDRLSTLFENFPETAIEYEFVDGEPVVRDVNEAFVGTFGYDPATARGATINELVVPPERYDQARSLDEQVRAGERLDVEVRRQTASGERDFRIRNIATPDIPDADGYAIYSDVTGRKRREQELERERDRMRAITEAIPDVIILYDAAGRYQEVLTGQDDLLVDEPGTLQGQLIEQTVDDEAARALHAAIDRTLETGTVQTLEYELELDGARTWFEGRLAPFRSGDSDQVVLLARDVTERKTRERKLDRLRERTRKLMHTETVTETAEVAVDAAAEVIETPSNGVHLLSDDERTLEASVMADTVAELFEEVPRYPRDAEPGTRAAIVWDAFERGEPLYIDDTQAYEPLTEPPLGRSVLMHPVGRHGMFIAAAPEPDAYDETDKALFEILATSLTTALDRVVREAGLRERERQLEHQNERLEEFASVISHDLRNPLNVLMGSVQLADETGDPEAFERSRRAMARMEQLIDDTLTLARAGQTVADVEPVALAELIDACWSTVETADAELHNQATQTLAADASRLQQLLENLVRNAVKHGGPAVTITIGDLDDGFYVEDDGPGIPADVREAVFDSGFTTAEDGTGFGLAIVEQIAAAHGWEIDVAIGMSGGARFEITGVDRLD